jgi:hypothetical protein
MKLRRKSVRIAALAAVLTLAASAAQAFTFGGEAAGNNRNYEVPKFDLEEQARNFRNGGTGATPGRTEYNTPLGNMQFGVQQGPRSSFGPGGPSPSVGSRVNRMDFERMVTPEGLR